MTLVDCVNCGKRNRVPEAASGVPRCGSCHHPLPWIAEAGDGTFAEVAERADLPVVVDFWARWCQPCRTVTPVLEQLSKEMAGRLKIVKVDVDRASGLARRFAIKHVPMMIMIDHGQGRRGTGRGTTHRRAALLGRGNAPGTVLTERRYGGPPPTGWLCLQCRGRGFWV
ncbi:thioredoxin family protein [Acrocarpospora catenulata]|uniref:thioredoxin family protein n=1 Tax=Acrocarpospora catenulata TaxID=2836182 RepID=UPI001BD9F0FE|nr:thioredoxin domain-containing protein [Acrocarpospora catenulata]